MKASPCDPPGGCWTNALTCESGVCRAHDAESLRARAEKAEAELATARKLLGRFVDALGRTTFKELDSLQDEEACVELLEAYLEGRLRPTAAPPKEGT